jgi:nicotinamidase-related amidase
MPTLIAKHCAVLVVDMQNDFCHREGHYGRAGNNIASFVAAIEPVSRLIGKARDAGAAVAYTRLVYDKLAGSMEDRHVLKPRRWIPKGERLRPGTWGAAVIDELAPIPGDIVIDKAGYSAFESTDLETQLRSRGVTTIIVCGVVTYACVLATAFTAFDRGFDVVLVSDATGSWSDTLATASSEIVDLLLGHAARIDEIEFSNQPTANAAVLQSSATAVS